MSQPHVVVIRRVCTISSYYGSMYVSHIAGTTLWIVLFREAKHCGTPAIFEPPPYPMVSCAEGHSPAAWQELGLGAWRPPRALGRPGGG